MKPYLGDLLRVDYKMMGQERKEVFITIMIGLGLFKEDSQSRLISEHIMGEEKSGSAQARQGAMTLDKSSRDGGMGS